MTLRRLSALLVFVALAASACVSAPRPIIPRASPDSDQVAVARLVFATPARAGATTLVVERNRFPEQVLASLSAVRPVFLWQPAGMDPVYGLPEKMMLLSQFEIDGDRAEVSVRFGDGLNAPPKGVTQATCGTLLAFKLERRADGVWHVSDQFAVNC